MGTMSDGSEVDGVLLNLEVGVDLVSVSCLRIAL